MTDSDVYAIDTSSDSDSAQNPDASFRHYDEDNQLSQENEVIDEKKQSNLALEHVEQIRSLREDSSQCENVDRVYGKAHMYAIRYSVFDLSIVKCKLCEEKLKKLNLDRASMLNKPYIKKCRGSVFAQDSQGISTYTPIDIRPINEDSSTCLIDMVYSKSYMCNIRDSVANLTAVNHKISGEKLKMFGIDRASMPSQKESMMFKAYMRKLRKKMRLQEARAQQNGQEVSKHV